MNPWLLGSLCFAAGAIAGSGGTYTYFKEQGRIIPAASTPVKK